MDLDRKKLKKAIIKSQHCQRNWDLTKKIPQNDLEILKDSVTQAPSLQNVAFYKIHFIQDRDIISKVHECTHGAPYKIVNDKKIVDPHAKKEDSEHEMGDATQSQTLANLVVLFEDYYQVEDYFERKRIDSVPKNFDRDTALGIASGYLNLTANLLGYSTGCCTSIDHTKMKAKLQLEREPLLVMGVGYKQDGVNRRVHQIEKDIVYPTNPRQEVPIIDY